MVHLDELERQMLLQQIDDEARAAIAGIDHDFQRLQLCQIDIGQQVPDVGRVGINRAPLAACRGGREVRRVGVRLDILQSVIAADGAGLLADEFHAVVIGRIMACGDHDAAVISAVKGCEVHALRAADPDVINVHAAVGKSTAQRIGERGARQPDIAAHDDATRGEELRVAASHAVSDFVIQVVRNPAPQVIGLEAGNRLHVVVPLRP